MIIHVIQPNETAFTIADIYGVSPQWIIRENGIVNPIDLAVGGTLVILYPKTTHTVVEGDTLESIANMYNVTVMDLLRNNSYISDQEYLEVGDTIVIDYEDEKIRDITTIGYCYPFIEENILKKTLPYLTYLIIYSYVIQEDGSVRELDDSRIIEYAKTYGVAPVMIISFAEDGVSETEITHLILNDESLRNSTLESVISSLIEKEYSGISISPVYVYPSDEQLYVEFLTELISRVHDLGLIVFDTIAPNTLDMISDIFTTQRYIQMVNELVDSSILFPISIGFKNSIPTGTSSYCVARELVEYFLQYSEPENLQLGINTVGYMWELPYIPGVTEGHPISVFSAILLARDYGIPILYDEGTQLPYFIFQDEDIEILVRFVDARSIVAYMAVVEEFNLNGIGVWNIMAFFNALWLIVNSQYNIVKVDSDML